MLGAVEAGNEGQRMAKSRRLRRKARRKARRDQATGSTQRPVGASLAGVGPSRQGEGRGEPGRPSTGLPEAVSGYPMPPRAERPTPEQIAKVEFAFPAGPDRHDRPAVNLHVDMIAQMMRPPALLHPEQHDAARDWQALRAEVMAEHGIPGLRSCLDVGIAGHDDSHGDVALADYWRRVRTRLGPARVAVLDRTCVDGAWPRDMEALREALDAFAVVHGGC